MAPSTSPEKLGNSGSDLWLTVIEQTGHHLQFYSFNVKFSSSLFLYLWSFRVRVRKDKKTPSMRLAVSAGILFPLHWNKKKTTTEKFWIWFWQSCAGISFQFQSGNSRPLLEAFSLRLRHFQRLAVVPDDLPFCTNAVCAPSASCSNLNYPTNTKSRDSKI